MLQTCFCFSVEEEDHGEVPAWFRFASADANLMRCNSLPDALSQYSISVAQLKETFTHRSHPSYRPTRPEKVATSGTVSAEPFPMSG